MRSFALRLCARLAFLLAAVGMAVTIGASPAAAETTVKWLYIETNPEIIQYWKDVIAKYEQAHPG
jgi:raffinose/stachyose/melibiose transport system substrate-binding protein